MFALAQPETRNIMSSEMQQNQKFRKEVTSVGEAVSSESKDIHKLMRQLYALRSKGAKKSVALTNKIKHTRSKYCIRKIELVTGMTYRQVYRIVNPPHKRGGSRKVSQEDRLAVYKVVLKTVNSMQIPYRRFAKYFYLRETIKDTYRAYVKEQKELGLRILSESSMYKNLPSNVRSQKYIPFMECLCVKCLNMSNLIDALKAAGVTVQRRAIQNVIASICPFLVHKKDIEGDPKPIQQESCQQKTTVIRFGKLEQAEFDKDTLKLGKISNTTITNNVRSDGKKHDPNMFLIGSQNAPQDITVETVVTNSRPECMFRECNNCGVHKLFHKLDKDNPNMASELTKSVVWFKWTSFVEKVNGQDIVRPFDRYRFDGTLQELMQLFFDLVHNMSKHLFHFKWQALQYEQFRRSIEPGEVGLVMDFGQNINHRKQIEAQSTHYNRRQSTIFPLVCFFPCMLCSELVTHEICCITDDLKHDAFAVRAFELKAIEILKADCIQVNHLFEWSDNCGLEFKSKFPFYVLSHMKIPITRNYWGENHGKGPADSVIGRVSQFMRSAIARSKTAISHGMDMALYLQEHKGSPPYNPNDRKCEHYRKSFAYVDSINREDLNTTVKTLKGTRELHSVQTTDVPGTLNIRRSSCMCRFKTLYLSPDVVMHVCTDLPLTIKDY